MSTGVSYNLKMEQHLHTTRWVALMIQLEQQQHGEFVCGVVGGWLTPTTYIQLAGAGSKINIGSATSKGHEQSTSGCWINDQLLIMRKSV